MILSNHTATGGAKGWCNSHPHSKGIWMTGCGWQITQTPSIPGSPLEPWHCLWSCVWCWWLGELPYRHVIAHLPYYLNKALFYNELSDSITVGTTASLIFKWCEMDVELHSQDGFHIGFLLREGPLDLGLLCKSKASLQLLHPVIEAELATYQCYLFYSHNGEMLSQKA